MDLCIVNGVCRCCLSEGNFKSLGVTYLYDGNEVTYSVLLRDTFNIMMTPSSGESNTICEMCVERLQDSAQFKKQVLKCEQSFAQYLQEFQKDSTVIQLEETTIKKESETEDIMEEQDNKYEYKCSESDVDEKIFIQSAEAPKRRNKYRRKRDKCKMESNSEKDSNQLKEENAKSHTCDMCDKTYKSLRSLNTHRKSHSMLYLCYMCNTKHKGNKDLIDHIEENHCTNGKYACTLCTEVLEAARLLKNHLATHFEEKLKCVYCNKRYNKKCLKEHMKIHTGDKRYKCDVCSKSFVQSKTLKLHVMTHTGERPFVCDICGRRFPQKVHLQRHISVVHEGSKPYPCLICNRQFATKSYLEIHGRTHTGETPYTCDVCKKNFKAYTTYKVHKRIHSGEKPYTCSFCNKQFSQTANFKIHQRIHTGVKPYSCCRVSQL